MPEIFPVSYWGSIRYYAELIRHPEIQLEVCEHFPKQTHRNRFQIVAPDGVLSLTASVTRENGSKTRTKDVRLITERQTLIKNWRAVVSAYASSPFFDHYERDLETLFLHPQDRLHWHSADITRFLLHCWGHEVKLEFTEDYDWQVRSPRLDTDYLENEGIHFGNYEQVRFSKEQPFHPNMSALDLLCNLGPMGRTYLFSLF